MAPSREPGLGFDGSCRRSASHAIRPADRYHLENWPLTESGRSARFTAASQSSDLTGTSQTWCPADFSRRWDFRAGIVSPIGDHGLQRSEIHRLDEVKFEARLLSLLAIGLLTEAGHGHEHRRASRSPPGGFAGRPRSRPCRAGRGRAGRLPDSIREPGRGPSARRGRS